MYVYVCVCMLIVSACIACILGHCGTEPTTMPPKHSIVAQHQAGPTQSTPGHVPIHFIPPSQSHPSTRLRKSVFGPVLPRPHNQPGPFWQIKTWPNRPFRIIVRDVPACAEIKYLFLVLWCIKDDARERICVEKGISAWSEERAFLLILEPQRARIFLDINVDRSPQILIRLSLHLVLAFLL